MPELIEVEVYRRLAQTTVGRRILAAEALDPLGLRPPDPAGVARVLAGLQIVDTDRIGKLLLLATDGPTIGLRFGMTGRLVVDGRAAIDELEYGSSRDDPAWDRYVLRLDRGELRIRDPRRLGGLELDPDLSRLGPDATTLESAALAHALAGSRSPVKARLLDQRRVAGLGNLLVDESLWRAGIHPACESRALDSGRVDSLATTIRDTVAELSARGGSHTGDLQPARTPGATCPRDGAAVERTRIGGRTTYLCPVHQH